MVGQKDTHATKAMCISPEMHITGAAETTGADAAAIPSPIIWSGRVSVLAPEEKASKASR